MTLSSPSLPTSAASQFAAASQASPVAAAAGRGLRIGVFDSGIGGLSVLRAVHRQLPEAALLYVADAAHAPYGQRDDAHIVARSHAIAGHLWAQGAQLVVVACNTATAAAVESLRARHPERPIVGVEPGLKPAVAATRNGHIGILATPSTIASARFALLLERVLAHVPPRNGQPGRPAIQFHPTPCPGLASAVEAAGGAQADRQALLAGLLTPLRTVGIDTLVLGCTHYPLIADEIQLAAGEAVQLIDTAAAVAAQVERLAGRLAAGPAPAVPLPEFWSTGSTEALQTAARRWVVPTADVHRLDL